MTKSMEIYISRQLKYWQQQRSKAALRTGKEISDDLMRGRPFVTISREYGCGGFEIASMVVGIINNEYKTEPVWAAYDKKILEELSSDMGFSTKLAETLTADARSQVANFLQTSLSKLPSQMSVFKKLAEIVRTLAINGNVIVVGRGGAIITQDLKNGLHIKIVAPVEWRVDRISRLFNLSRKEALEMIKEKTKKRRTIFNEVIKYDIMNPYNYHIVINNSRFTTEDAAHLIIGTMKIQGFLKT